MDNCTCSITIDTSPDPVGEAEQDPFCLVHPVEQEVLAEWIVGFAAGLWPWPDEDELQRIIIIQSRRLTTRATDG